MYIFLPFPSSTIRELVTEYLSNDQRRKSFFQDSYTQLRKIPPSIFITMMETENV